MEDDDLVAHELAKAADSSGRGATYAESVLEAAGGKPIPGLA